MSNAVRKGSPLELCAAALAQRCRLLRGRAAMSRRSACGFEGRSNCLFRSVRAGCPQGRQASLSRAADWLGSSTQVRRDADVAAAVDGRLDPLDANGIPVGPGARERHSQARTSIRIRRAGVSAGFDSPSRASPVRARHGPSVTSWRTAARRACMIAEAAPAWLCRKSARPRGSRRARRPCLDFLRCASRTRNGRAHRHAAAHALGGKAVLLKRG